MADVHSPETRSYNMSQIKGKDTKPEMLVRTFLHANGYRYRLHGGKPAAAKALAGRPDIVLPKYHTVIFVHGCFWHGHKNCKYFVIPKTNTEWWMNKIHKNVNNDRKNKKKLTKLGWRVIEVWECELKSNKKDKTLSNLFKNICKN